MSQVSQLSPELARGVLQLARALLAASRNWTLYPPEHPTVGQSVVRFADAIKQSANGQIFSLGITPDTLMIEATAADPGQSSIAEAARLLHDCDLLRLTFVGDVPTDAIHAFLRVVTMDAGERRTQGGPAAVWAPLGHASIILEQIDYQKVLAREQGEIAEPARRDNLWKSIVLSISGGQRAVFDKAAQERLLSIAGSPGDIADLATATMAPKCAMDGSPMITSQAATVLAAFRHLTGIVGVMAPDRMPEVMGNMAAAATQLDPHVVMQVLQTEEDPAVGASVVRGVAAAFDDAKVAQLLATSLAIDGTASDRLATIFNTIAPDEDRKRRVLTLTRSLLNETDFGKSGQFQVLWASMEELLISYNDKPFVSENYRAALDGVGGRAERMAVVELPEELPVWMESLGQESVRTLSVRMLIDLLTIETDAARAPDIARDMEALAEDLLMAGAYDDTRAVVQALADRAGTPSAIGRDACRHALDTLGESLAMIETASLLGDFDDGAWQPVRDVMLQIGAAVVEALKPGLAVEKPTVASTRAEEIVVECGDSAVMRLASLFGDKRWFAQTAGARLLGRIAAPAGVPLLQPLLRQQDPRVIREAVTALGNIPDASAARAIHTVLRAATGGARQAVVDSLVADRDPRVVPMLARILAESEPLGKDHDVVLEALTALGVVGSDTAVPALSAAISRRGFFGRKKLRAIKERGVRALVAIGGDKASAALDHAATHGDRMLKKVAAQHAAAKG